MVHRRQDTPTHHLQGAFYYMANAQPKPIEAEVQRIKLTARLSTQAYDAISEIQRQHRHQTGKALPLWRVLDAAINAYAQTHGVRTGE
jgi:hypothetical protein